VGWAAVLAGGRRIDLPTDAFQYERYWPEPLDIPALLRALGADRPETERETESWRYRISWTPVTEPAWRPLSGTWLVVVPAGQTDGDLTTWCAQALTARGAHPVIIEAGPEAGPADRTALAAQITEAEGVLSLLAGQETPEPGWP
jgi:hypothetical protein